MRPPLSNLMHLKRCGLPHSALLLTCSEPGGYLQWDEADFGGLYVNSPHPSISCGALEELKCKVHGLLRATKGTTFG